MLNRKPYVLDHKNLAERKLAARTEMLKSKGLTDLQIKRDHQLRHYQAAVRKAKLQLAGIAKLESEIARKAEIKAEKSATAKTDEPKPKKSGSEPVSKKARKGKKTAAAAAETEN
jgi:hypothetical protein